MTDQAERYDRIAHGYASWWAPVLAPVAVGLLDRLDPAVADGATRLVDIGTGTGTLAIAAVRRWPEVEVVGVDASRGMTEAAVAEADARLPTAERRRFEVAVAFADALPFADGAFDAGMSSFVFQLVPNRFRALREAHRVLHPGGTLAYVTWLASDRGFEPDAIFDDVLEDVGIGARDWDDRPGDIPSASAAAGQLRRAGFAQVEVEVGELSYAFDVDHYMRFLSEFDEEDLFRGFEPDLRERVDGELRARLSRLSPDELTLRLPVVCAVARRR